MISGLIASWKDKMVELESIGIITLLWFLQVGCFAIRLQFWPRSFGFANAIKMFVVSDKMDFFRKKGMQVSSMFFQN